jgi:hypothetical protein
VRNCIQITSVTVSVNGALTTLTPGGASVPIQTTDNVHLVEVAYTLDAANATTVSDKHGSLDFAYIEAPPVTNDGVRYDISQFTQRGEAITLSSGSSGGIRATSGPDWHIDATWKHISIVIVHKDIEAAGASVLSVIK